VIYDINSKHKKNHKILIDNNTVVIDNKDLMIETDVLIYTKPDKRSRVGEYKDKIEGKTGWLKKGMIIKIIGYSIINNKKWYYIDTNTDDNTFPDNYLFGWIIFE
jgi:hypothetical protein